MLRRKCVICSRESAPIGAACPDCGYVNQAPPPEPPPSPDEAWLPKWDEGAE